MPPKSNLRLVFACKTGNSSLAMYLLRDCFADINCSSEDFNPLTAALSYKNTKLAISLLNQADTYLYLTSQSLNKKDVFGGSPIMAAVELGKSEAVKEMIKVEGVDLKTVNSDGESLLEVAR